VSGIDGTPPDGIAIAVCSSAAHTMAKALRPSIRLLAGIGVEGDAHAGATVRHRSRVAKDPGRPNLRQVHLIHAEMHDALSTAGMPVVPGQMGENVTTRGVDLLALSTGARLHLGASAVLEITGLRNPCTQLDGIHPGLMAAMLRRNPDGSVARRAGVMAIVLEGGEVLPGDRIWVEPPAGQHRPLEPV